MPIFAPDQVQAAVDRALKAADVGDQRNAFVAVVTYDAQGQILVRGVVSTKVSDTWTIAGSVTIDHTRRIEGGLEVKATW